MKTIYVDVQAEHQHLRRDKKNRTVKLHGLKVGLTEFESVTPSPPDLYANQLRYSPMNADILLQIHILFKPHVLQCKKKNRCSEAFRTPVKNPQDGSNPAAPHPGVTSRKLYYHPGFEGPKL